MFQSHQAVRAVRIWAALIERVRHVQRIEHPKDDVLVSEVNGPDVDATNSFETPRAVDVRETRLTARGHRFEHEFPAHSISLLRVPLG